MFKVKAILGSKSIEELFITKKTAQHFAERLIMEDFSSQPTIEECEDFVFFNESR